MMQLFGKKEPETISISRGVISDRVKQLVAKGFSEPEMIDVLRKEGYRPDEIDQALTQVMKEGVIGPPTPAKSQLPQAQLPELPALEQPPQQMPMIPEASIPQEEYYYQEGYSPEEYVDYALKEKLTPIDQRISEMVEKNKELRSKIDMLNNQLITLTQTRTSEQQQILTKIEDFKDSIEELSIRMSSMEKAFKDTLPALIESVRALSDLVQRVKREV